MDRRAVGVFDSGVGGLTAVRELRKILPSENIIYFGDTSRVPYGVRSRETLVEYSLQDVRFLRSMDVKAVLVACGTATTASLPELQQANDVPVFGVVEAACRRAAETTRSGKIGLIATDASLRTGAYERTLRALNPKLEITSRSCPLFVPLVENGRCRPGDVVIETVAREYLEPMKGKGIDTLILGCTHYPLLSEVIQNIMGPDVTLISAGKEAADALRSTLMEKDMLTDARTGELRLFVSGEPENFTPLAEQFLGETIVHPVGRADIEQY